MRTTVTIDDDVARELKSRAKMGDKSFKQALNEALRLAFSISRTSMKRRKKFRIKPHHSAFRGGIDFEKLNQLSDQLEVEHRLPALQRHR